METKAINRTYSEPSSLLLWCMNYIDAHSVSYSRTTLYNYNKLSQLLRDFINSNLNNTVLDKSFFYKFTEHICSRGYSNTSIEVFLKKVVAIYNFQDKYPPFRIKDVLKGYKRINQSSTAKPYITLKELTYIREFVKENYQIDSLEQRVMDLFVFSCHTGCRYNELITLRKHNVVKEDKYRVLKYTTGKNGREIELPLSNVCLEIIKRNKAKGNEYLLDKVDNFTCNKVIHDILTKYGMIKKSIKVHYSGRNRVENVKTLAQTITFHSSRRSFASNMINSGLSLQDVSDCMGISVNTLLKWYAKTNRDIRFDKTISVLNK